MQRILCGIRMVDLALIIHADLQELYCTGDLALLLLNTCKVTTRQRDNAAIAEITRNLQRLLVAYRRSVRIAERGVCASLTPEGGAFATAVTNGARDD